jgi:hypothetical protein
MPEYFMLGNAPNRTVDYEELADHYDVRNDPDPSDWWIAVNDDKIQSGDMFVMYLHPTRSFYAVGVFTSDVDDQWVDISLRRLKTPIVGSKLARLAAWRTRSGGRAKPFSRNPDGTPNAVFANGTRLTDDRWASIWDRLAESDRRWLKREYRGTAGK